MKNGTILLVVLTLAPMFLVGVTASEYDPWLDTNDDGKIDIFDIVKTVGAYGTSGTPINKTELILNLTARVELLEDTLAQAIDELNTRYDDHQTALDYQGNILNQLTTGLSDLNESVLDLMPDYDGGWYAFPSGEVDVIFTHNLGTSDIRVYLMIYGNGHLHYRTYGCWSGGSGKGGYWWTQDNNNLGVSRESTTDYWWESVRVLIWKVKDNP